MSPNCVPYPRRSSVLLLVPITIPSGHERSYSMLLRSRAILFPTRILPATSPSLSAKYASICLVIGTSSSRKRNIFASSRACRRDSSLEVRYGVNRPSTRSGPRASAASATASALSMPPETPTTARLSPAFATSSRMKSTTILRTSTSSIRSGEGSFGSGRITPVRARVLVTALERKADAIDVDEVHGQVLRVEAVHEPTRLGGAEVAALGDAAARARRRTKDDRRAGRGVEVWHRDVPEVFANGDPGAPAGGRERLEAIAGAEVAPVIEDPVRRQIHLAMDMNELAFRPVALGDVQLRVTRALHEPGRHVEIARRLCERPEERIVD